MSDLLVNNMRILISLVKSTRVYEFKRIIVRVGNVELIIIALNNYYLI